MDSSNKHNAVIHTSRVILAEMLDVGQSAAVRIRVGRLQVQTRAAIMHNLSYIHYTANENYYSHHVQHKPCLRVNPRLAA